MANNTHAPDGQETLLLQVMGLSKHYVRGRWPKRTNISAATDVDFHIPAGQTLALVGSSGSGKSTVARCVSRMERPDAGQIWIAGTDIAQLGSTALLPFRSKIQMIFQDAVSAMNPRFSALAAIEEPLRIQGSCRSERLALAQTLMKEVKLSPDWLNRPVMDFSGGQRQRLAIARALTLKPQLLILDEALSGLDLSTQAQVANLLLDLQQAHSLTYLLISHDLTLVGRMAGSIAVMSEGRTVEMGPTTRIVADPQHSATRKLLASARAAEQKFAFSAGAGR
jgi:ABC-type glutathione transport system ATPase component